MYSPLAIVEKKNLKWSRKYRFHCFGSRETCLARDQIWIKWLVDHGTAAFIDVPKGKIYDYYFEEPSTLALFAKMLKAGKKEWRRHLSVYRRMKRNFILAGQKLGRASRDRNRKNILKAYLNFINQGYEFCRYIWMPWSVIYVAEPELTRKLGQDTLAAVLDQPIEFTKMRRDLFKLTAKEMVKKYGWLNAYSVCDAPYHERDFKKMKKSVRREEVAKEFRGYKTARRKFEQWLKGVKDEDLKLTAQMVHLYAFLKTDRIDTWKKGFFNARPFYEFLADTTDLTLREAANLFVEEVMDFLHFGPLPDLNKLKLRSANRAMYYFSDSQARVIYDKKAIEELLLKLESIPSGVTELRGTIACQGRARGRVKVVAHSSEVAKVQKGDILVARYTFPSFMPAIARSAAMVTDEGGLTNHAAIVSRELNIPCLIGTKIATKVLKDGQLVEVDATKGIVRIIK